MEPILLSTYYYCLHYLVRGNGCPRRKGNAAQNLAAACIAKIRETLMGRHNR